jgi:hypothetical protein
MGGAHNLNGLHGNGIMTYHLRGVAELLRVARQVVHEGIVVIDNQNHGKALGKNSPPIMVFFNNH